MQNKKTSVVTSLFWAEETSWNEVHACLERLCRTYHVELGMMRGAAFGMAMRLNLIFPVFDLFCEQVCVECRGPCCLNALVAFDFADLLLMHALSLEIPPHQIRRHDNEHCRYLEPTGCTLERIRRPFVCTWYYCAPMLELLAGTAGPRTTSPDRSDVRSPGSSKENGKRVHPDYRRSGPFYRSLVQPPNNPGNGYPRLTSGVM